jgi:glycosyltransferase involved in cell wall biosynthesis
MKRLRIAVVADHLEEEWPSMDVIAEMILMHLQKGRGDEVDAVLVRPPYRRPFGRFAPKRLAGVARNADRVFNRYYAYPRRLAALARRDLFDVYHIVDHSYAQLVAAVPAGRTVVTCHDLDTFRCLLEPAREPRPGWFRALVRRTLEGFKRAGEVACDSGATFDAVRGFGLIPDDRLHLVPICVHPEYFEPPNPAAEAELERLLGPVDPAAGPEVLHVGSTIPRKRIDVLLNVFAGVRRIHPRARLLKAGGRFTTEQEGMVRALNLTDAIRVLPFIDDRRTLAALYRRAALVLQPSEAEGFGLPLVEAMATGAALVVSDIPVFHEVAAAAAVYAPVGDVAAWVAAASTALADREAGSEAWRERRRIGLERANHYRWDAHAAQLVALYRRVAASGCAGAIPATPDLFA